MIFHPLFETIDRLKNQLILLENKNLQNEYPSLNNFLSSHTTFDAFKEWELMARILITSGRRSHQTFNRFRTDFEKFAIFIWCVRKKSIFSVLRRDVDDFVDWFISPPSSLISNSAHERFVTNELSQHVANSAWRPFIHRKAKPSSSVNKNPHKSGFTPSQATIIVCYSALSKLFNGLLEEGIEVPNWVSVSRSSSPHINKSQGEASRFISEKGMVKRLSDEEWDYIYDHATKLADQNPSFERALFLLCCLKSLFLRISELSSDNGRLAVFSDFWKDANKTWHLNVIGKGNKLRSVTLPDSFIDNLKRYRTSRGLTPLPSSKDHEPIILNSRRGGGLTSRALANEIQKLFDSVYKNRCETHGADEAQVFLEITTHWLRHTGASMTAINDGIDTRDLAEELGHSDPRTTERVYIRNTAQDRGQRMKRRSL
jgi:integrase